MTERKTSTLQELKIVSEEEGIVEAFVNSMGVIDSDGDVLDVNSFDQSIMANMPITVLLGHDPSKVVGKVVEAAPVEMTDGAKLYNRIQFNMDTQLGRETFSNIKFGALKEYSIGFNIPEGDSEFISQDGKAVRRINNVDWVETSAVLRGASPNTGTLSAKSEDEKGAIPYRETATTDESWDGPAAEASIPNDAGVDTLRRYFAYVDSEGDPDAKSSYKFIHHEYPSGAASLRACSSGIGVLNGARGGTRIEESAVRDVYEHLRDHLLSADVEAPELRYSGEVSHSKEITNEPTDVAAVDDQPQGEAWLPTTDEVREQVVEANEYRRRLLGLRLQKSRAQRLLKKVKKDEN